MYKIAYTLLAFLLTLTFTGCANKMYYAGMEKVGFHKRDIMVSRVADVQDSQKDAQEEFKSALEQFESLVKIKDTNLKAAYERFSDEYEDAKDVAENLSERIGKLEDVALALFEEWEEELELYQNKKFKATSAKKLKTTYARYNKMVQAMRESEKSMEPILATFQDNVLMLKHSLNAQAIGGLQEEFNSLEKEIDILIAQMNNSIKESDSFISEMQ